MCYSFFFFFFLFHHYQLFSSSRLCWHVRVSYASIALRSTTRLDVVITIYWGKKEEPVIDTQHDTVCKVRSSQKAIEHDTMKEKGIIHNNVQTRMIEWQNRIYLFVLFFRLVWSSSFTPPHTTESMCFNEFEVKQQFIRVDTSMVEIDGKKIKGNRWMFQRQQKCVEMKEIVNNLLLCWNSRLIKIHKAHPAEQLARLSSL